MGKGRNSRRKRLKRLKNSVAKKKKQRAPSGGENKTPARVPKSRRKRRGSQKHKGKNMTNKLKITPGNTREKQPIYINMAISTTILLNKNVAEKIQEIKGWLDRGVLTRLVLFSYGKFNSSTRRRLKEILVEKGLDWAWPYIVSPFGNESTSDFIQRIIKGWDINYLVDSNPRTLKFILMQRKFADLKIFYFDKEKAGWEKLVKFLRKDNPQYWGLQDKHPRAFDIISSKYYWERELPVIAGDNNELAPEISLAGDNSEL